MSIHEIEIEGLGPEWEPVKLVVRLPATAADESYECVSSQELVIRRKVSNYDLKKPPHDWPQKIENENGATFILKCVNDDGSASYLCAPKVRKYDWGKTHSSTLVARVDQDGYWTCGISFALGKQACIADLWQPNIHGKCPVDGEASIVRIRTVGGAFNNRLAKDVLWDLDHRFPVTAWQFIRLADGWEWA